MRDLDDALTLVNLFAAFPSHAMLAEETGSTADRQTMAQRARAKECERLAHEFMTYCTITQSFTKTFLSIKGLYYQAEIGGQNITWLVPYPFSQRLPFDVDYKIMLTFLEFYRTLLKFVLFKLYSELGLSYPP